MSDTPPPAPFSFRQVVELIEHSAGDALASGGWSATPSAELLDRFPELRAVSIEDVVVDGPHGEIAVRVYHPPEPATGTGLVWVHGGAFIAGDLDMPEANWVSLTIAAQGHAVVSVEYRKALHGVHYPVPSDDVLAAWRWATTHAEALDVGELHLGGASAGGNLAAGVTKRLRDGEGDLPATLMLVYPVVHAELPELPAGLRAIITDDPVGFTPAAYREMSLQYAGDEEVLDDPYAFPANGDLSGQPPVYIVNAETDPLRASGEAYASLLAKAGVDVTVETEPGSSHGHINEPDDPAAKHTLERLAAWLARMPEVARGGSSPDAR